MRRQLIDCRLLAFSSVDQKIIVNGIIVNGFIVNGMFCHWYHCQWYHFNGIIAEKKVTIESSLNNR